MAGPGLGFVMNQLWRFITNLADDVRSPQRLCSAVAVLYHQLLTGRRRQAQNRELESLKMKPRSVPEVTPRLNWEPGASTTVREPLGWPRGWPHRPLTSS